MAKNRAFLLKFSEGVVNPFYRTMAGLRVVSEGFSENEYSIEGAGVFAGSAAEHELKTAALSGAPQECELSFNDGEKLRGRFTVQRLEYAGSFNGESAYTVALQSGGSVHSVC